MTGWFGRWENVPMHDGGSVGVRRLVLYLLLDGVLIWVYGE